MKRYQVLALGAGVQSTAVLLMSVKGVLPKLDAAVFADPGWEPEEVYRHLEWLEGEAKRAGIAVHRVSGGNIREDILAGKIGGRESDKTSFGALPLFVSNPDGTQGRVAIRRCTGDYKITPLTQFLRLNILGLRRRQAGGSDVLVDLWMGISADEASRMKPAPEAWKRHVYPLCGVPTDMLPKPWRRADCVAWLTENYPGRAMVKSSCVACPFRTEADWRRIRAVPEEWAQAVEVDKALRYRGSGGRRLYVHRSMVPLDEVDFGAPPKVNEPNYLEEECEGHCGV